MGTYTGRTDNVPKKFKGGMAVVVMFKPEYPLLSWELAEGIIPGKWLKAKVFCESSYAISIELKGGYLLNVIKGRNNAIVIRSTSLTDNPTSNERDKIKRNEAKKRRRALAKAAK